MADQPDRDQKTEEATPRRRQEAREKGQVAFSAEAVGALSLVAWVGTLLFTGGFIATSLGATLVDTLAYLPTWGTGRVDVPAANALLRQLGGRTVSELAVVVLPVFALVLAVGFAQTGFKIAPKAISLDWAKLNPIKGMGRLFSMRTAVRTGLALLKILFIAVTITVIARSQMARIVSMDAMEIGPSLTDTGHVILRCVLAALVAIVVLAALDFVFQRFQHDRDLRMSKQEIKDEVRQTDGDPHLRGRIRQLQREMASRRMMQDVPKATVIVTNPTHYAVALLYERSQPQPGKSAIPGAPRVVAKGVDLVAQRIKDVARESGVPLYEDVPLARALHAQCEIGDEIPLDLYQAVAGVLAYVYRVNGYDRLVGGGVE